MKPPEKLPNQQTCSMLCIYKYKYQYIIFHCHPPIGLVATPVCLNPSQANSTDAPSGDGWQYIYMYLLFVVHPFLLLLSWCAFCIIKIRSNHPSLFWSYQRSSMKISVMASGNSNQQKWGVQLASLFVIYHLVAMHDTWLPNCLVDSLRKLRNVGFVANLISRSYRWGLERK